MNYYNDNEPYVSQWLRNLVSAGHLPAGDIDERSIANVCPDDLREYRQCHFFAGIGGWPLALRLAGWPEDREVWTGSCPCQPLSCAGQRKGHIDKRHLWPSFYRLIAERRPATIFGEQVASKDGREWLAAVRADLENIGYAIGCSDLCAASVGAPHIRQRLFFVAHRVGAGLGIEREQPARQKCATLERSGEVGGMGNAAREQERLSGLAREKRSTNSQLGNASGTRSGWNCGEILSAQERGKSEWREVGSFADEPVASSGGPWSDLAWIDCIDGKRRPIKPGIFPLVTRFPKRMAILRAAGNAIVPQCAQAFIEAYMKF